ISRKRLTDVSPIFADMFELPPVRLNDDPIVLPVDLAEFEHFLWYLHVSHLGFAKWDKESTGDGRFRRVLGIAAIAHVYQAMDIAVWAVAQVISLLPSQPIMDAVSVKRLYEFALRADGVDAQLQVQSRNYWCARVRESQAPVDWLLAAKELNDKYLQAYTYFHILKRTGIEVIGDSRLTVVDRLRLLLGVANLRRFTAVAPATSCTCPNPYNHSRHGYCSSWNPPQTQHLIVSGDHKGQPIMADAPLQDKYGTLTLWEVFTHSAVGIQAEEDIDALSTALAMLAV
ncbi:hypothetical protein BKA62DRAFT_701940, partial [Auriculariales sp. MPI-PUGE-AT-0066]